MAASEDLMNNAVCTYGQQELDAMMDVLNAAIESHQLWLDSLHISILCGLPFPKDVLHKGAHTQCDFGTWYYSEASGFIKSIEEYSTIEPVHKYMHSCARDIAFLVDKKDALDERVYREFLTNQHRLIGLLTRLRDTLIERGHCFDTVTGAANRRAVTLMLDQIFENSRRYNKTYTLVMLDVDHFKNINDQFGHVSGDHVLKGLYQYFRNALRKSDFIGRYGGEEFLILLPETTLDKAFNLMDKCREGMSKNKLKVGDDLVNVTVSIGISEVESSDSDAWEAVKRADKVLYQAKDAGRNCVQKN